MHDYTASSKLLSSTRIISALKFMRTQKWFFPALLAGLFIAIFLPLLFTGYSNIKQAEIALAQKDYKTAAYSYERAARLFLWRADLWEKAALAASKDDNCSTAITFFTKAPELSEEGWLSFGYCYYRNGNLQLAQETFEAGLRLYSSPSFYEGLALIRYSQKDWQAEREALQNQLSLGGGDARTHYRLGLLLTFLNPQQALDELTSASSLNPQFAPAVQTLLAALSQSATQPDPSQQMVTVGRSLGLVQEWDLSIAAFEKAIDINAENAEAWAWLGEAQQQTGQDGSAALDQAISLDHNSVIVRALRGLYWNRQGKYDRMLAEYSLAAKLEPQNPAWQASIGNAHTQLGDLAAALDAYENAVALAPEDATYWRLLAVFCAENGVHIEDIGLPAAQKAVEISPNDPNALDALGFAYFSSGRFANAEQTFLKAIELAPEYFPAHLHLAMNYLLQGNRSAAYNLLSYVRDADISGVYAEAARQLLAQNFP